MTYEYTDSEVYFLTNEYTKCKNDVKYFVENHIFLNNKPMKLKSYQEDFLSEIKDSKRFVLNASPRLGKTTMLKILILHEVLFNTDKMIALLGFENLIPELLEMYNSLPDFLTSNIESSKKDYIRFENGMLIRQYKYDNCDIMRGYCIHFLCMDNYSYLINKHSIDLYKKIIPVVTAGKNSKILITGNNDEYSNNHYNTLSSFDNDFYDKKWLLDISSKNR